MKNSKIHRFWEIDLLRGIAIIMMVIFHIFFDISFFDIHEIDFTSGFNLIFNISIPVLFLLLVGISMTLKFNKYERILKEERRLTVNSFIRRGLFIFTSGLLITLITWFLIREGFVIFGILHLIGISIIISFPLLRLKWPNLILGIILILIGIVIDNIYVGNYWLVWIGFTPSGFYTIDYFPILPWLGVVLIGIFIGNSFYPAYKRNFSIPDFGKNSIVSIISFLGRYSLFIYFIHQPIIILILMGQGFIDVGQIF